jgi:hypothetical protein
MHALGFAVPCPHCQHLDQVRKVSAIVAAGTAHSGSVGRRLDLGPSLGRSHKHGQYHQFTASPPTGQQQSVLARRLAAPEPPKSKRWLDSNLFFAGMVCLIGILVYWSVLLGAVVSLSPSWSQTLGVLFVLGTIGLALALSLCVRGALNARKGQRRAVIRWSKQMDSWNCSLYCGRCDTVFPSPQCGP